MGIMPSYADSTEGMGVDGVLEDSPAAEAGMKDGDIIIRIGGQTVRNVYDYMAALNRFKPGDTAEVTVRRDGKEVTLPVKLAGSK
jgi:S1-C subfamily serine protease